MEVSKIHLSPTELQLFCNAGIILTKNTIICKTISLLEEVQQLMLKEKFSGELFSVPPKISKGENYSGLPYVILDYPRRSEGESIFFIRSMFWWGNFFSSTLHISGRFKDQYQERLTGSLDVLAKNNFFIGINDEDPWAHHFGENNYRPISAGFENEYSRIIEKSAHVKLAAKWPLEKWDSAIELLYDSWKFLVRLIA